MKHRMFFAINLSEDCRRRIFEIIEELKNFSEPIKWEQFEKLHITTVFLGDVHESIIPKICETAQPNLSQIERTEISFNQVGVFPNLKSPRVIWIGIKKNEIIEMIGDALTSIARGSGIDLEERKFHPHVTLGRVKGQVSNDFISKFNNIKFTSFTDSIGSVELMKSELDRFGSKYYIHTKFNLREN
ncbi:MAG: RNA 2',3'-cyclic phosphodiesterase [Bacteroidetes bacterium]|nr:RNA 2',3'-cyclic phosphodiesterase [Bacteroidota bacterium]MBU2584791.1 RNA 2',3'-cyclic phosphodiesterase [Bacteroidota bacterium]